jgi:hypothetical protein
LGAAELLRAAPGNRAARALVEGAAAALPRAADAPEWPWPESRLTYANALLPEAALAVAHARGDSDGMRSALALLRWLVDQESNGRWFSFTPVGGRGAADPRPGFDQQPIEAAAMAAACARAHEVTGEARWAEEVRRAARWFLGGNDIGAPMFDAATGGAFDGLGERGPNRNQGAESALAFVSTMAQARHVGYEEDDDGC